MASEDHTLQNHHLALRVAIIPAIWLFGRMPSKLTDARLFNQYALNDEISLPDQDSRNLTIVYVIHTFYWAEWVRSACITHLSDLETCEFRPFLICLYEPIYASASHTGTAGWLI
jgi:hypothetical protein